MKKLFFLFGLLGLLSSCGTGVQPTVTVTVGDLLVEQHFDAEEIGNPAYPRWDSFSLPTGQINFGIVEGVYLASSLGGGYIWAQNDQTYQDIVVEVTVDPQGQFEGNAVYGISCRAHPLNNNMGYYFLLDHEGRFGIRRGDGTDLKLLHEWEKNSAIAVGGTNTIRAACVQDYLAMWVNGTFLAEVRYDWLDEGALGFTVNSAGTPVAVAFDNLRVWSATLGE